MTQQAQLQTRQKKKRKETLQSGQQCAMWPVLLKFYRVALIGRP